MSASAAGSASPSDLASQRRDANSIVEKLHAAFAREKSVIFLIPRFRTVYIEDEPFILDMGMTTWVFGTDESKVEHWVVVQNEGIQLPARGRNGDYAPWRAAAKYTHGPTKTFKRQDRIPGLISRRIEEAKKTKDLVYIVGHGLGKPLSDLKAAFKWEVPEGVALLDTQLICRTQDPTLPTLRYALRTAGRGDLVDSLGNSGNDAYCVAFLLEKLLVKTAQY